MPGPEAPACSGRIYLCNAYQNIAEIALTHSLSIDVPTQRWWRFDVAHVPTFAIEFGTAAKPHCCMTFDSTCPARPHLILWLHPGAGALKVATCTTVMAYWTLPTSMTPRWTPMYTVSPYVTQVRGPATYHPWDQAVPCELAFIPCSDHTRLSCALCMLYGPQSQMACDTDRD